MGNQLSRPYRPPKERPMAFLRRKLGKMTRKDKINRMVSLTFLKDEAKLHQFSEWARLTRDELRIYYEKIDAIAGEFVTDIPEVEFRYSPEVTSDSETSSVSSASSDNSSVISVHSPVYDDPVKQKNFEQFCLAQYGTKICVHQNDGSNVDGTKKDISPILSSGDTKHKSPTKPMTTQKCVPRQRQKYALRKKKTSPKSVKLDDKPECKEALMVPTFKSPSRQRVLHTPVPITCTDITDKKKEEEALANEKKDQPLTGVKHSPEICVSTPKKDRSKKKSEHPKAAPKSTTDIDADEVPVFKSPSKQLMMHTPVPIIARVTEPPDELPEAKEVPVFKSPSKQLMMHTPVPIIARVTEPPDEPPEAKEVPVFKSPSKQLMMHTPVPIIARVTEPPDEPPEAKEVPVFKSPSKQLMMHTPVPIIARVTEPPDEPLQAKDVPVFKSPSKQLMMHTPVPIIARVTEPPDEPPEAKDVPVFKSPSKQLMMHTPVPIIARVTEPPDEPPEAKEVPVFKSPSKQLMVHTPVPIIARVTEPPDELPEAKEVPIFKKPSKQLMVHTPVPIIARITEPPEEKLEAKKVPVFKSPTKQRIMHTPVPIVARVTEQPEENLVEAMEVPVYLDPSRQPVQFKPVPKLAQEHAAGPQQAEMVGSPVPQLELQLSQNDIKIPKAIGSPGSRQLTPNNEGRSKSQASLSRQAKIEGKINQGLRTTTKAKKQVKVPKCPPKIPEQPSKSVEEAKGVASADIQKVSTAKAKNPAKKPGFIKRCVDNIKRRTESALSDKQVIKVKPASPDCTVENHKPVRSQPQHLKAARPKVIKKRVISQTNLRPDKGIVWPTDFDTLNTHNKSYYVEQFLRSELFKQRCKRKHNGGTTWMNGLSKFQLWVIEHEGTDAIEEVLNPVKKNKSDAKAKVQCWRDDSPEC